VVANRRLLGRSAHSSTSGRPLVERQLRRLLHLFASSSARRCRRRRNRDCFAPASLAFRCPAVGRSAPAAACVPANAGLAQVGATGGDHVGGVCAIRAKQGAARAGRSAPHRAKAGLLLALLDPGGMQQPDRLSAGTWLVGERLADCEVRGGLYGPSEPGPGKRDTERDRSAFGQWGFVSGPEEAGLFVQVREHR
jgi:hypothetical protein